MTEPPQPTVIISPATSAAGRAVDTGGRLLSALPPAFLLLCLINIGMMYLVLNSVDHQLEMRTDILQRVITQCLDRRQSGS